MRLGYHSFREMFSPLAGFKENQATGESGGVALAGNSHLIHINWSGIE